MSKILKSIHGREVGLDHDGYLLGKQGFASGQNGRQIFHPSPNRVSFFDDFLGDAINLDNWLITEGTDSATSASSILSGGIGGVLRMTPGDAGTGYAADALQVSGPLQWQASNGGLYFETRIKLARITNTYAFLGFTDVTDLEAPVTLSVVTFTTNATDAVGWMFDTTATTDTWRMVGVANNVDATMQDSGVAPVADDYETLALFLSASGVATFFRNGLQVGTAMTGAVTATADLSAVLAVNNTTGTDATLLLDVDYVHVAMNRAADGGAV